MSFTTYQTGTYHHNWLESEVGLVLKTYQIAQNKGEDDGYGRKIVKSGTPYPEDGVSAVGIVFEDVDVTSGDMPGSVMVAGRVHDAKLSISGSKTTLAGKGFTFVDTPAIKRGFKVTYNKGTSTGGTPPTDDNSYFDAEIVTVSSETPLTKDSFAQKGWCLGSEKASEGDAIKSFKIDKDTTLYPVLVATD